ncbi:MAG: 50S ribosomal protein L10 [Candidatus Bathyarchaeia archaeon]|nr:50S ribosomal protein L10 [Candidatus Bathyarchaeota archaeon]
MLVQMRSTLLEKSEKIDEIKALMKKYRILGVANLHKVRATQLQEIRRKMEEIAYLKVYKNTLVERALRDLGENECAEKLKEFMQGSNLYIFTNYNPFKLALLMEKSRVKASAKAGDIATEDIVVQAGNTGLPPGPIISQLNAVGIPTRIESGSVWVSRETVVAKKGTVINESLASVLSKLGIKPIELGLSLKAAYDEGTVITESDLKLDIEEYKKNIGEAYAQALNLAVNAAYPTHETVTILLCKAVSEARNLAINSGAFLPETLPELIRRAHIEALTLEAKVQEKGQASS